jgi:hypothetical protein
MKTKQVFCMRASDEEGTPRIDAQLPENSGVPWGAIGEILRVKAPVKAPLSEYEPIHLTVREEGWQAWNYYPIAGTFGLFSHRLIELIGAYMEKCFAPYLQVFVNELPYYFLRPIGFLDCLDRAHSDIVSFPHDPHRVMRIKRYRFFMDKIRDPMVFVIPETLTEIFATQSIKTMIEDAKLPGLIFLDAEQIGSPGGALAGPAWRPFDSQLRGGQMSTHLFLVPDMSFTSEFEAARVRSCLSGVTGLGRFREGKEIGLGDAILLECEYA